MRSMVLCLCVLFTGVFMPLFAQAQAVQAESRILAIGDSLMAWHMASGASIADAAAEVLGEPVINKSVGGAKIIHALPITGALGMKIASQFSNASKRFGPQDWVIMNGGGNDLFLGCGCNACDRRMARMINPEGAAGEIPRLVSQIRQTGARVVYIGYLRSPGVDSLIDACLPMGNELEARLALMAKRDSGVHFLSLDGFTASGDRSMHGADMIHPSRKASKIIGENIARLIQKADKTR